VEINEEMQIQLKKIETEKLNKALHYASQISNCRSKEILNYFDELDAKPCGVCDVCLNYFSKELSAEKFKRIQTEIITIIKTKPTTLNQLQAQLKFSKPEVEIVLKYLFANELVIYNQKNILVVK